MKNTVVVLIFSLGWLTMKARKASLIDRGHAARVMKRMDSI